MKTPLSVKLLPGSILFLLLPLITLADITSKKVFLSDTINYQEKKSKKENLEAKHVPDQPDIAKVPKARKQSRPPVVVKPNIKAKPVKIIRPKIKKP